MNNGHDGLILLPRLRVENANAISGPLTWGFPSPTAFTGFTHALNRKFGTDKLILEGTGIVCHRFDPQVNKPNGKYNYRFNLARHPLNEKGETPGTVEEGRAHMEVSLIIGVRGYLDSDNGADLAEKIFTAACGMRLAGGSIRSTPSSSHRGKASYLLLSKNDEDDAKLFRSFRRRLIPGFILMSRHDLLEEHTVLMAQENPDATSFDALLDITALHIDPENGDAGVSGEKTHWHVKRAYPGWLVPLPVGYGAISNLYEQGAIRESRDQTVPFRFVESLCSLGEWVSPHRLTNPRQILWFHRADPEAGLYIVTQENQTK